MADANTESGSTEQEGDVSSVVPLVFHSIAIAVTAPSAVCNAVTVLAWTLVPWKARQEFLLLVSLCIASFAYGIATALSACYGVGGQSLNGTGCLVTGSVRAATVLTTAFSVVFLVVDRYITILYSKGLTRNVAFCFFSWLLAWALVVPQALRYWGRIRYDACLGYCDACCSSVRLVHSAVSVVLPAVIAAVLFPRLFIHVRTTRKSLQGPAAGQEGTPRFMMAMTYRDQLRKLDADLTLISQCAAAACALCIGYLPHATLEALDEQGSSVSMVMKDIFYLWFLCFMCWSPFLNLARFTDYAVLCKFTKQCSGGKKRTQDDFQM